MKQNINYIMYLVLLLFCFTNGLKAQNNNTNTALNTKEQSIVVISAFTAKGNIPELKIALHDGLNVGLSINEIKEMMLQLYAYTGFPRSLNGLNALIAVLKERKQNGIIDSLGKEPSPFPATAKKNKRKFGTAIQTKLVGQPVKGEVYEFAPVIDAFLKEHLFGDIFGRDNLDFKTREIVTIAALASIGGAENQLRSHFNVGRYNGLTEPQLIQLVSIIQNKIGTTEGNAANEVLQGIMKQQQGNTKGKNENNGMAQNELFIRIAEIEVYPEQLEAYTTILKEEAEASVKLEPGVICIFPMYQKKDNTQVRLLEIYANRQAYEAHIKSPHFQKYKTTTTSMVKTLQLVDMEAIDVATMTALFRKLNN